MKSFKHRMLTGLAVLTFTACVPAFAVVLDMEGIAPAGGATNETNTTRAMGAFNFFSEHGHFYDSAIVGSIPVNGTDWFLHDNNTAVVITRADGGTFSAQKFDASGYNSGFGAETFTVTGFLFGGGTVSQSFTTDLNGTAFETFSLMASFNNLVRLEFQDPQSRMGYDNITLDAAAAPEPATLALLGLGLAGFGLSRRRKQ